MPKSLTIAEVDALFFASLHARGTQVAVPKAPRPWVPRYDRCSGCREIGPCLSTFSGTVDWPGDPSLEAILSDYIEHLRHELGRRTILLCSTWCRGLVQYQSERGNDHG